MRSMNLRTCTNLTPTSWLDLPKKNSNNGRFCLLLALSKKPDMSPLSALALLILYNSYATKFKGLLSNKHPLLLTATVIFVHRGFFHHFYSRYGINITALPAEVEEADDSVVLSSVPASGSKLWREEGNAMF